MRRIVFTEDECRRSWRNALSVPSEGKILSEAGTGFRSRSGWQQRGLNLFCASSLQIALHSIPIPGPAAESDVAIRSNKPQALRVIRGPEFRLQNFSKLFRDRGVSTVALSQQSKPGRRPSSNRCFPVANGRSGSRRRSDRLKAIGAVQRAVRISDRDL